MPSSCLTEETVFATSVAYDDDDDERISFTVA